MWHTMFYIQGERLFSNVAYDHFNNWPVQRFAAHRSVELGVTKAEEPTAGGAPLSVIREYAGTL